MLGRLALVSILLFSNALPAAKVLVRDRALFRIERQAFFKEAFLVWVNEWKTMSCGSRRSMLLHSLELEASDFNGIDDLLKTLETRSPTSAEKQSIEKLIRLVKLILYVQEQPSNKSKAWPNSFDCVANKNRSLPSVDLVARAEVFLHERFRSEKRGDRATERSRARAFLESVLRGQSHEIFL